MKKAIAFDRITICERLGAFHAFLRQLKKLTLKTESTFYLPASREFHSDDADIQLPEAIWRGHSETSRCPR